MASRGHSPVRTCVACRQEAGKRELIRLVRDAGGEVRLDATGKSPGRGAYLHRDAACVDEARRRGSLSRALRATVPDAVWTALQA